MRYTPVRCTFRGTPHEMHACEVYAHEVYAYEVHGHEVYACEVHGHELHARDMHAYEVHACEMIVSGAAPPPDISPVLAYKGVARAGRHLPCWRPAGDGYRVDG